jgi:phosphatidate cytidylyltransferase
MRAASPWADFAPRTLSALVLLPLVLACIWWGGASWSSLMAVCVVMLVMEWWTMTGAGKLGVAPFLAGVGYIALAVLSLLWLRADPATGRANILFLLIVIWATDIGAYLVGRAFGGPRLAPSISPGKTWSGTIGGVGVAMLTGLALSARWPHGAWTATLLLAALISVASQAGDLLESAAKRRCGVKDSGRLIPGHGGLLDRVDGVLFAAPVMAALGLCLGREIVLWS